MTDNVEDELGTPPRPGPGATIACVAGVAVFLAGWLLGGSVASPVLLFVGALTVFCSWLYAHMRDRQQAENMADEYLERRRNA